MDLTEIVIGVITRAHGVRGEVVVSLRTDEPERRFTPGVRLRAEAGRDGRGSTGPGELTVVGGREHQGRWLVTFAEVPDRNAAEALRGRQLVAEVAADEAPDDEDEYYDRQLVGLEAYLGRQTQEAQQDLEPLLVGRVRSVLHLPAQDVLEIETENGVRLVPFVAALVPEVDLGRGRVLIVDQVGLLSDEPDADEPRNGEQA